jgi:hypothetical protein
MRPKIRLHVSLYAVIQHRVPRLTAEHLNVQYTSTLYIKILSALLIIEDRGVVQESKTVSEGSPNRYTLLYVGLRPLSTHS